MIIPHVFFFLLKSKDETYTAINKFLELIKNQFDKNIEQFRSDHGREFENNKVNELFDSKGII